MASITEVIAALANIPSIADIPNFETETNALLNTDLPALITQINTWAGQANTLAAALNAVATGGAMSVALTFDTTTADADPGAGKVRLNQATQNTATVIRLDLTDVNAVDWSAAYDLFDDATSVIKGFIKLQKQSDGSKWLLFSVASMASPSGYRNITVACVASSAASPFTNGDTVELEFTRNGDAGPAAWQAPTAWLTATAYVATDPRSVVTYDGETYVCLTSHTSGTFATDLAAAKWVKVATKGVDGTSPGVMTYAIIQNQLSSGTVGGSLAADGWRDRVLQTEAYDPDGIVSISSNQFTLQAGTYRVQGWGMVSATAALTPCQSRIYNVTDTAAVDPPGSTVAAELSNDAIPTLVDVIFTIAGAKAFKFQTYPKTWGIYEGRAATTGGVEVYSSLTITKLS